MTIRYEIVCAKRMPGSLLAKGDIITIGYLDNGSTKQISVSEAIRQIEAGISEFYVKQGGKEAKVIVAHSGLGGKFLKTVPDGIPLNNLSSLKDCP